VAVLLRSVLQRESSSIMSSQHFALNSMALSEPSTPSATDPVSMLFAFDSAIRNSFLFSYFPKRSLRILIKFLLRLQLRNRRQSHW
jgi:hypothetical protein